MVKVESTKALDKGPTISARAAAISVCVFGDAATACTRSWAEDTAATLDKNPSYNPPRRARDSEDGLAICIATDPSIAGHVATVRAIITRSNSTGLFPHDISFSEGIRG